MGHRCHAFIKAPDNIAETETTNHPAVQKSAKPMVRSCGRGRVVLPSSPNNLFIMAAINHIHKQPSNIAQASKRTRCSLCFHSHHQCLHNCGPQERHDDPQWWRWGLTHHVIPPTVVAAVVEKFLVIVADPLMKYSRITHKTVKRSQKQAEYNPPLGQQAVVVI